MFYAKLKELQYRPLVETDCHKPIGRVALERELGSRLSDEFAIFLEQYPDTGIFEVEGVVFVESNDRLSGRSDGRYAVDTLYAACSDKSFDLVAIRKDGAGFDLIPDYCLRIGQDSFGNAFCLDLREDSFGKVYFWDHEHSNEVSGLHLVALNFREFVDRLEVVPR